MNLAFFSFISNNNEFAFSSIILFYATCLSFCGFIRVLFLCINVRRYERSVLLLFVCVPI